MIILAKSEPFFKYEIIARYDSDGAHDGKAAN
jgi:hypothetical protein